MIFGKNITNLQLAANLSITIFVLQTGKLFHMHTSLTFIKEHGIILFDVCFSKGFKEVANSVKYGY